MSDPRISFSDAGLVARESVGIQDWEAYRFESVANGVIVTGCVPHGTYSRGKYKGKPRFDHPKAAHRLRVAVSNAEIVAFALRSERETGKCWECNGTGRAYAGWNHLTGVKHRDCSRCSATGAAPEAEL